MRDSRMLYQAGGDFIIDGHGFKFIVVHESDVDECLLAGWFKTPPEALKAKEKPQKVNDKPNKLIPPSELTDEDKQKIERAKGTQRDIATRFNVSTFTVSRIKSGKIK